jgi:hypothetical protein
MTIKNETTHLNNLRKIINISEKIDILMEQSLKLMDIVNENQKAVNDLKAEQDKLKGIK